MTTESRDPYPIWGADTHLRVHVGMLRADLDAALALLRRVDEASEFCLICGNAWCAGHTADCRLSAFLTAHPEES